MQNNFAWYLKCHAGRTDIMINDHQKIYSVNWDSHHARLNNHYKAWSCKKKKHKKIKAYRKSIYKEPKVKRCLLILDLKPLKPKVKGKHSVGREFQRLAVRGKKRFT